MRVLFVATVRSHIGQFHMPFIRKLKELGCTVDGAYKDNSEDKQGLDMSDLDHVYEINFSRSPYSKDNVEAYKQLKKIIEEGNYDVVHCHTPMGAVVTRLAAKKGKKKGLKVIYTAHGFHFYKGAPSVNWRVYYPIEKYLSHFTDCLITINNEDFSTASTKKFRPSILRKINGVGVDLSKFKPVTAEEKSLLRLKYGFSDDDFILIYPADFCERKNQSMIFEVMKRLLSKHKNIKLLLPGLLDNAGEYIETANDMGIADNVLFMGYRRDIENLVALSDVSVSTSRQEGLPINLVEAMAVGNPIVATNVRGNNDLVEDSKNGYLVELNDCAAMAEKLLELYNNRALISQFGEKSIAKAQEYSEKAVLPELVEVYEDLGLL